MDHIENRDGAEQTVFKIEIDVAEEPLLCSPVKPRPHESLLDVRAESTATKPKYECNSAVHAVENRTGLSATEATFVVKIEPSEVDPYEQPDTHCSASFPALSGAIVGTKHSAGCCDDHTTVSIKAEPAVTAWYQHCRTNVPLASSHCGLENVKVERELSTQSCGDEACNCEQQHYLDTSLPGHVKSETATCEQTSACVSSQENNSSRPGYVMSDTLTREQASHLSGQKKSVTAADRGTQQARPVRFIASHTLAKRVSVVKQGTCLLRGPQDASSGRHKPEIKTSCNTLPSSSENRATSGKQGSVLNTEHMYACTECNKVFNLLGSWSRHKKMHTGRKPRPVYMCRYCDKSFARRRTSKLHHMNTHTGDKPYMHVPSVIL